MNGKDNLHRLVELLPDEEFPLAQRFLQFLADEAGDGPLIDDDLTAAAEGEAAIDRGDLTTLENLKHELGL